MNLALNSSLLPQRKKVIFFFKCGKIVNDNSNWNLICKIKRNMYFWDIFNSSKQKWLNTTKQKSNNITVDIQFLKNVAKL